MNLCSSGHQEICYEGRNCPLCAIQSDKEDSDKENERKIEKLKDEKAELESDLYELRNTLTELQNRIALYETA
jgi:predicted RNase H-like nuclease (RuvC/YqgF family)